MVLRNGYIGGKKITGKLQREGDICHIIAEHIEDISYMLDEILN